MAMTLALHEIGANSSKAMIVQYRRCRPSNHTYARFLALERVARFSFAIDIS